MKIEEKTFTIRVTYTVFDPGETVTSISGSVGIPCGFHIVKDFRPPSRVNDAATVSLQDDPASGRRYNTEYLKLVPLVVHEQTS